MSKPLPPKPLSADELDAIHHCIGVAINEGMMPDDEGFTLRAKVAALEEQLRLAENPSSSDIVNR